VELSQIQTLFGFVAAKPTHITIKKKHHLSVPFF